jgi:hypothetical protein
MTRIYLFILSPPNHNNRITEIINTSLNVSVYNSNHGSIQTLYKNNGADKYFLSRWDPTYNLDMNMVNNIFNKVLDTNKQIWVETSSPNMCRANQLEKFFKNKGKVYFIILMSHPYSKLVKNELWETYGKYQKNNLETLKNTIYITYEDCCMNISKVILQLTNRIPELGKLNNNINKLSINYKETKNKKKMNKTLYNNYDLLHFFGYNIMYNKIYESKDGKLRGFYNEVMDYNIFHGYDIELDHSNNHYTSWRIDNVSEAAKLAAP